MSDVGLNVGPTSYRQQLHQEHMARVARLSRRAPEAGPMKMKPKPRVVYFNPDGTRKMPVSVPKPFVHPVPAVPVPAATAPLIPVWMGRITVDFIMLVVAEAHGMKLIDLKLGRQRKIAFVRPRQIAAWLTRDMLPKETASFSLIASRLGGFDHSTIINSIKRVNIIRAKDQDTAAAIEVIRSTILERAQHLEAAAQATKAVAIE